MKQFLFVLFLSLSAHLSAQVKDTILIDFIRADDWSFDEKLFNKAQFITGNVILKHDSAYFYCDTLFLYRKENRLEAHSNIKMQQGDSLTAYSDYLYYDGNTKIARLRKNVKMINKQLTLLTDSCDYNRRTNIAYYFNGGVIFDDENELTSDYGKYNLNSHLATFQYNVLLHNPKMDLTSDTLHYNTENKIARIIGPSKIVSDSTIIHSTKGQYNTRTGSSDLLNRSQIIHSSTFLWGDSIHYERSTGIAKTYGNLYVKDTLQKTILKGNYGFYNNLRRFAFSTDSATCISYTTPDSIYIHADTLKAYTVWGNNPIPSERESTTQKERDSIITERDSTQTFRDYKIQKDSIDQTLLNTQDSITQYSDWTDNKDSIIYDTIFHRIEAYYGVRVYSHQLQSVCDSLAINSKDTIMKMHKDPIIWNNNYQIFADYIQVFFNDSTLKEARFYKNLLTTERKDSIYFDQIEGNYMRATFDTLGELKTSHVEGNVNIIFFPVSKDSIITQMVRMSTSFLDIYLKNRKYEKIKASPSSNGVLRPINKVNRNNAFLKKFDWYNYIRPRNSQDIYRKIGKKARFISPKTQN